MDGIESATRTEIGQETQNDGSFTTIFRVTRRIVVSHAVILFLSPLPPAPSRLFLVRNSSLCTLFSLAAIVSAHFPSLSPLFPVFFFLLLSVHVFISHTIASFVPQCRRPSVQVLAQSNLILIQCLLDRLCSFMSDHLGKVRARVEAQESRVSILPPTDDLVLPARSALSFIALSSFTYPQLVFVVNQSSSI